MSQLRASLSSLFGRDPQLNPASCILAGKDLYLPRSAGLAYLALVSTYEAPQIISSLQCRFDYRSDLGMIRLPDLDLALFLPIRQTFLVPKARERLLLQCSSCGYVLPSLSPPNQYFELSGQLLSPGRLIFPLCLNGVHRVWSLVDVSVEGSMALYHDQLSEHLRGMLPRTLEPAPLQVPTLPNFHFSPWYR